MDIRIKTSTIIWVVVGLLFFVWLLWPVGDGFYDDNAEKPIENESAEINDNFSNISEAHWGHMPLTYRFENECIERLKHLMELGFGSIQVETSNDVSFIETSEEPDISIYCKPSRYERGENFEIADAFMTLSPDSENLIVKGEINIYGQGMVCETGYPALEVHEILHLFDMPHNPLKKSIMHQFTAESSSKCKITQIGEEYISCLRYIYSNGEFNGNCSFPNFIHEDPPVYGCGEGLYEVEGTDYCCPEPNMKIEDGYCA